MGVYKVRPIKFRGKSIETGQWVYGYFVRNDENGTCYIITQTKIGGSHPVRVIPETVGEFTGRYIKNGNEVCEIYEGDIIQYQRTQKWGFRSCAGLYEDNEQEIFRAVVEFNNGAFIFTKNVEYPSIKNLSDILTTWDESSKKLILFFIPTQCNSIDGYDNAIYKNFGLIGNIHDNPNLIE